MNSLILMNSFVQVGVFIVIQFKNENFGVRKMIRWFEIGSQIPGYFGFFFLPFFELNKGRLVETLIVEVLGMKRTNLVLSIEGIFQIALIK